MANWDLEDGLRKVNCKVCTIENKVESGELNGESAYQVAVDNGFQGTEEEWLMSLIGPQGPSGDASVYNNNADF